MRITIQHHLSLRKRYSRWVSRKRTVEQKDSRIDWSEFVIEKFEGGENKTYNLPVTKHGGTTTAPEQSDSRPFVQVGTVAGSGIESGTGSGPVVPLPVLSNLSKKSNPGHAQEWD
ncbi:hypothetical protein EVAR_20916_1 [Eumeta japonica]|uniref:Uncharacterized protein n=1 Tax=Eumeta variegata TaxID=151549 RepID=A0A4C1UVD5_EUMVA|nr:hypothetical protein EVAR_20916_1 [Eumeta japonica]